MRTLKRLAVLPLAILAAALAGCGTQPGTSSIGPLGSIQFNSVNFSLSSGSTLAAPKLTIAAKPTPSTGPLYLNSFGKITGLGTTDVTVVIQGTGTPEVTCTNQGGTASPGQNPSAIVVLGEQPLDPSQYNKNGSSPYDVTTGDPPALTWDQGGCANSNWTAAITFIYWTDVTLTIYPATYPADTTPYAVQHYTCNTTKSGITCKLS